MTRSATREDATALLIPMAWLAATLFLLSADLLFVRAGFKIKYGYFLVLGMWLFAPSAMLGIVAGALRRIPPWVLLPLVPLAISVGLSVEPRDSVAWTLWFAFDLFTIVTVYAFLRKHAFTGDQVRTSVFAALAAMTCMGLVQFVSIYGFHKIIFEPQSHFAVYRINGVSGWPHFLNIFAFLLLPIVLVQRHLRWPTRILLVLLSFVLVQSTAKTGWVLFVTLGALLLVLDQRVFRKSFLTFLLPVTIVLLLIPTPSFAPDAPAQSGSEKISRFAADLNLADKTTSGTDRVLIGEMGLKVWLRHPWFGVGPRAYDVYVWTRFDRELPGESKFDGNLTVNAKNENIWIELLAESGALFTLSAVAVIAWALRVRRFAFVNRLHLGAWIALVLYYCISGQFSQSGLLTMVYAVWGIYFYARELSTPNPALVDSATVLPSFG